MEFSSDGPIQPLPGEVAKLAQLMGQMATAITQATPTQQDRIEKAMAMTTDLCQTETLTQTQLLDRFEKELANFWKRRHVDPNYAFRISGVGVNTDQNLVGQSTTIPNPAYK